MSKNVIGKRIKELRKQKKLTQNDLSKLTGYKQNTISSHENGTRGIDEIDIMNYCEALGVTPTDLFQKEPQPQLETLPVKKIPVVSQISAGLPIYSEENLIDYTYIATKNLSADKELFGLKVSGDSMDKEFKDGDVVIVEKDAVVENGQIAVVQINGYNATVKRVRYEKDRIILIPESNNPAHYPQVYSQDDEVKIIGRVVASQRLF
ncbi:XRE family transcriptional regulator [Staphylococcus pettenkoferi]|uniref:XRE family transcriptional regulator n=2 Tax=Staphylococcus TaxID=1279 RepID=A0ABT4BNN5_9STAP|nr:XRE family transcriptional regulator [Staphylococcus pettenkoferi]MCY1564148.1 XRE family transcriptional regulator [Staphylococcus pettenkoferi]MCY1571327.1 XRE family transcriptional regulator [Staphylococcus pettenkoferi]MCY1584296.1 XRE family transcriptional regulator [Staphylococcus pettenkoferi]MCY1606696.1 XRE family transcriptional regulator [Staphylococcus pettenkoferi]MDH9615666.1 XRE family transcriptional regulator [Staphylococcus pettenkoferi]